MAPFQEDQVKALLIERLTIIYLCYCRLFDSRITPGALLRTRSSGGWKLRKKGGKRQALYTVMTSQCNGIDQLREAFPQLIDDALVDQCINEFYFEHPDAKKRLRSMLMSHRSIIRALYRMLISYTQGLRTLLESDKLHKHGKRQNRRDHLECIITQEERIFDRVREIFSCDPVIG